MRKILMIGFLFFYGAMVPWSFAASNAKVVTKNNTKLTTQPVGKNSSAATVKNVAVDQNVRIIRGATEIKDGPLYNASPVQKSRRQKPQDNLLSQKIAENARQSGVLAGASIPQENWALKENLPGNHLTLDMGLGKEAK